MTQLFFNNYRSFNYISNDKSHNQHRNLQGIHQAERALDYEEVLRPFVLVVRCEHLDDHFTGKQSNRDPNPNDDNGTPQRDGTPGRHALV